MTPRCNWTGWSWSSLRTYSTKQSAELPPVCKLLAKRKKPRNLKRRHSGSIEDVIWEGTPAQIVMHHLPKNERICKICGSEIVKTGKEVLRTLWMGPTRFEGEMTSIIPMSARTVNRKAVKL